MNKNDTEKVLLRDSLIWKYPILPFSMYCLLFQFISPYLGNPIIDTYTDLWVGFELLSGKVLYSEVLYPYGPVAPLLFKYLIQICNSHQAAYHVVSFIFPLILMISSWKIMKSFGLKPLQKNLILLFLLLTLFFNPAIEIFSIVRTYSWSSVIFVIAVLGIANECNKTKTSYLIPLLFTIAGASRPTMFAPISLVLAAFFIYQKRYTELILSVLISLLAFYLIFSSNFTEFSEFIVNHAKAASESKFHKTTTGVINITENLQNITISLLIISSLTALSLSTKFKTWPFCLLSFTTICFSYGYYSSANILYFSVPFITLLVSVFHARRGETGASLWGLLSFMLIMRFALLCDINLNSTVFIVPAITYLLAVFLREINTKKMVLISLILIATISDDMAAINGMDKTTTILGSPHHTGSREKHLIHELSELLSRLKDKNIKTVQVLPEGTFINLELGSPSPMSMLPLVPTHLTAIGEKTIINRLKKASPEYILIINRDYSEYFETRFGDSYGKQILKFIEMKYKILEKKDNFYTLYSTLGLRSD